MIFGSYHFADGKDPVDEANWFLKNVGDIEVSDILALDYEIHLTWPVKWCLTWLNHVRKKTGIAKILLYINSSTARGFDWSPVFNEGYELWIADPSSNVPRIGAWPGWKIWQQTTKQVPGALRPIDVNEFNGTVKDLKELGKQYNNDVWVAGPAVEKIKNVFTMFSQQDQRWANMKLGNTQYTMGRWGCLTTVITMGYNWLMGTSITPAWMVAKLKYNLRGKLIWDLPGMKITKRIAKSKTIPRAEIDNAYKDPDAINALEINNGVHFVWQIGKWWPGLGYQIVDPINGKKTFTNKYNNKVTGLRVIKKI